MTHYRDVNGYEHVRPADAPVRWRVSGYGVIVRDNRLLMVEPTDEAEWTWCLPGGGIDLDPEEDILDGITREVYEETGYRFSPAPDTLVFAGEARIRTRRGRHLRSLLFAARGTIGDTPDPAWFRPTNEILRVAWVELSQLHPDEIQWQHRGILDQLGLGASFR